MVDTTIMCELKEMIDEKKKAEQKEKKKAYMKEYMKKYHAKKMADDEGYIEKNRANQRKANNTRRQRDDVKESDKNYSKQYYQNNKKKLELFKQMEAQNICVLCREKLDGHGNNPYPVSNTGKCCDNCNVDIIIPTRLKICQDLPNEVMRICRREINNNKK